MPSSVRLFAPPALLCLLAALLLAGWWRDGQPVPLPDAPTARLECVSYSPSGATDGMPRRVTPEHIRADLKRIALRFGCVRTYSVAHGLDKVPSIARELGLEVLLGAWIGRDADENEIEIERAIKVARAERDVLRGIVVGNEVLLRHEQTPDRLAAMIRRVHEATGLPVTYADVWGFWVKHRAVSSAVSFVTVHIIPYWDDDPVGIDAVIPYVDGLYTEMQRTFPGKRVFIGETGWPSVGRPRGANAPGRVNQARYIREFTLLAQERGIPYNLIEAFDQPWKRAPEGTVGGYWGIEDEHGVPKFPLTGAIKEVPHGERVFWVSLGCGLAAAAFAAASCARRRLWAAGVFGAVGVLTPTILARQASYLHFSNKNLVDWIATLAIVAAGWALWALVLRELYAATGDGARRPGFDSAPRGALEVLREWRAGHRVLDAGRWAGLLRGFVLLSAAYVSFGLVFAGRHRDFPVWLFLPAAAALVVSAVERLRAHGQALRLDNAVEETMLASWLVPAALLVPWLEDFANAPSAAWGSIALALGLTVLVPIRLEAAAQQQTAQHADA
jgi:glucan 1,3-beta-glucosidase